ncbi:M20 family metallopeptidase [Natranaerobius thermophilus]|uniref:Probable succinyl-diaminopimelate desuccinylase n=1 Tax=Natranaerobius thermophilus (strain ATCC BAA-1301 / DSM 18059 / JW/NM-WN-LF) TaxID=457570 RepID=B2A609_NATTJ|nr:M20 family metallopeptidase [Natranaerobius thermophilus]ACB85426.1 acetylornithine deacetylase or succinyl-diaminopimelate desuccinylase [Natranaerobius thermophilus JW/NM-WN-LF]
MHSNIPIDREEILNLAFELIKIESHKEVDYQENKIAEWIKSKFQKEGIESETVAVDNADGRLNVMAYLPKKSDQISLMFNGHTDTVPPYGMSIDPFKPEIKEGKLYGRGAVDMKGGIAAFMATMFALKRANIELPGGLAFAGVIDEEQSCRGTEYIVKNGPVPDMVVVAEPTDMKVCPAHKGMEWIEVTFKGQASHGSRPREGINAVLLASEFSLKVQNELLPKLEQRHHEIAGQASINVGKIQGGDDPNIVPDTCVVQLDRRWLPDETIESITEEVTELANKVTKNNSKGKYSVRGMREATAALLNTPHSTDVNSSLVQEALHIVSHVFPDREPGPVAFKGWSDAAQLSNNLGTKGIVVGPGNIAQAHATLEYIDVEEIVKSVHVYYELAKKFCT